MAISNVPARPRPPRPSRHPWLQIQVRCENCRLSFGFEKFLVYHSDFENVEISDAPNENSNIQSLEINGRTRSLPLTETDAAAAAATTGEDGSDHSKDLAQMLSSCMETPSGANVFSGI
mgnify:CR=1 FL=1